MAGIEFLPDDPGSNGAGGEFDPGPRRRRSHWLVVAAAAVLAAGAVTFAVVHKGEQPTGVRPSNQPPMSATIRIPPDDNVGPALASSAGQPVLGVAVSMARSWVLKTSTLSMVEPNRTAGLPDPQLGLDASATERLVFDPASGRLWVVVLGDRPGRVLEYDANEVQLVRDIGSIPYITGAAALDGHLYVTSGNRLLDIAPGLAPRVVARMPVPLADVVPDVARGRLLATDYGSPSHIWAVAPGAGPTARVSSPAAVQVAAVQVSKASLGVSNGAIWLAGFDTGRGVLMRLDPTTLHPDLHSTLDPALEPGAIVVASGSSAIWVRDGGDGGELRCIDPATGRQLQTWLIGGSIASTRHRALVATSAGAVQLRLSGCPG